MKKSMGLLTVCLLFSLVVADENGADAFDARAALAYIEDLASDSMLGRKSGQPGGVLAEDYIASRFREWGIEPGGADGTYFQPFTFPHVNISPGASLRILSGRMEKHFEYDEGWRVWSYSGSGRFTEEIVFVGYGIHAPEKGYDDFSDGAVQGKMALLIMETPADLHGTLGEAADLKNRIRSVQKHGAKGVFVCPSPLKGSRAIQGYPDAEIYKPDFVIIRIEPVLADYIFRDLPTDLSSLVQEKDSPFRPQTYATGVMASLEVDALYDEKRPTRNVLGRISGSDEILKGEYIIVAAHMDHLGINPRGEIMNGANDNASGTAVAMEVARVLNRSRSRLKRTLIFFLWAAEEQGYHGLNHYCRHPIYPLEKTVAYITMDMVGHGSGMVQVSGRDYRPDLWEFLIRNIPEDVMRFIQPFSRFSPRLPDREPLLPTGIARIGIATRGPHLKYHASRDDVDLIKPELLERTGNFVSAAVDAMACEPGNLIPEFRMEDYYLSVVRLIDFQPFAMGKISENPDDVRDSPANVRLTIADDAGELTDDALRVFVLKRILDCYARMKNTEGMSLYASQVLLWDEIRQRRMSILPGLGSIRSLIGNPGWANVLAQNGIRFARLDDPTSLFAAGDFTPEGKALWAALEDSNLIIMVSGLTTDCQRRLLENARRPFILIEKDLPREYLMQRIKEKGAVLGLILEEEGAANYFQKLERAWRLLGSEHLMIVNGHSTREKRSIDLIRPLTREILRAGYEWKDIQNLFSGTFLRLFDSLQAP